MEVCLMDENTRQPFPSKDAESSPTQKLLRKDIPTLDDDAAQEHRLARIDASHEVCGLHGRASPCVALGRTNGRGRERQRRSDGRQERREQPEPHGCSRNMGTRCASVNLAGVCPGTLGAAHTARRSTPPSPLVHSRDPASWRTEEVRRMLPRRSLALW